MMQISRNRLRLTKPLCNKKIGQPMQKIVHSCRLAGRQPSLNDERRIKVISGCVNSLPNAGSLKIYRGPEHADQAVTGSSGRSKAKPVR